MASPPIQALAEEILNYSFAPWLTPIEIHIVAEFVGKDKKRPIVTLTIKKIIYLTPGPCSIAFFINSPNKSMNLINGNQTKIVTIEIKIILKGNKTISNFVIAANKMTTYMSIIEI